MEFKAKSLLVSLFLTLPTLAVALEPEQKFQSEDIFNLEVASSPKVAPNGQSLVYVRRSNDVMSDSSRSNIWTANIDGSEHRPLLSGKKNFYSPVWSPSGDRLAYISNLEGKPQLYVRWMDTGQTALISNLQSSARNLSWSPDGKQIAFTMSVKDKSKPLKVKMPAKPKGAKWSKPVKYVTKARYQADGRGILDPAFTHIFVVPADGGTARQLTSGKFNHGGSLSWSKDGERIYFAANRNKDWEYETRDSDIFSISLSGKLEQITSDEGAEYNPVVSPNGKFIAYLDTDGEKLAYRNRHLIVKSLCKIL